MLFEPPSRRWQENAVSLEPFDDVDRLALGVHHHEVCLRVDRLEHPGMGLVDKLLPVVDVPAGASADVFLIIERGHCGTGRYDIHAVRKPAAGEPAYGLRRRDGISDAQSR